MPSLLRPLVLLAWAALFLTISIYPVWDEVSAQKLVSQAPSAYAAFRFGLDAALFRPLVLAPALALLKLLEGLSYGWLLMRVLNLALLGLTAWLGARLLQRYVAKAGKPGAMAGIAWTVATLLSTAGLISVGWAANLFDVATALLLVAGVSALFDGRAWAAGFAFASATFCKESAILIFPFLCWVWLARPELRSTLQRAAALALAGFVAYWLLRQQVVALGSGADVRPLGIDTIPATLQALLATFWSQSGGWLALNIVGWGVAAMAIGRDRHLWLLLAALLGMSSVLYSGMVTREVRPLIDSAMFDGRLYLLPWLLFCLALGLSDRRHWLGLLCLPPLIAGLAMAYDYRQFQQTYRSIAALAQQSPVLPLRIDTSDATGIQSASADQFGNVLLGAYPDALLRLNRRNGQVTALQGWQPSPCPPRRITMTGVTAVADLAKSPQPLGWIDSSVRAGRHLTLSGWAEVNAEGCGLPLELYGESVATVVERAVIPRPDVAAALGSHMKYAGWRVVLEYARTGDVETAVPTVTVRKDGQRYRLMSVR